MLPKIRRVLITEPLGPRRNSQKTLESHRTSSGIEVATGLDNAATSRCKRRFVVKA